MEDAISLAEENYKSGKFVLENGEVQYRKIFGVKSEGEATEWVEF